MTHRHLGRRAVVAGALSLAASSAFAAEPPHDVTFAEDFDELWRTLAERYCYFGEKRTDWALVRRRYRPMAAQAASAEAFTETVRLVLAELYDAHTHLADPPDGAPRWPPFDLVVEVAAGGARIIAVDDGSAAADAGLVPGDLVVSSAGIPIQSVAAAAMPTCLTGPDPAASAYALNMAVAGRRGQPRLLGVVSANDKAVRAVALPLKSRAAEPDLSFRSLPDGFGLIRISTFADTATVEKFDQALAALKDCPGLIIDVRDNGGGDTAVARPIMGRFITRAMPYARMRRREGAGLSAPWTETVEPRGPFTYTRPVVVLCNAWSGSMAEGFPMGMRGIGRARVVGTSMEGLGAAVFDLRLDRTGLAAQYSGEPVYDIWDKPRSRFMPDVETAPGADIAAAGVAELGRMIAAG